MPSTQYSRQAGSDPDHGAGPDDQPYPGAGLGLPATGRGSLAPWSRRLGALLIDWAASMVVAISLFGVGVIRDQGWRAWMTMLVFLVERAFLTALTSGSFGQLLSHVAVVRLDLATSVQAAGSATPAGSAAPVRPIGWWRSVVRAGLKCIVIPAVIIGADRRGLDDLMLGTVVVNRR